MKTLKFRIYDKTEKRMKFLDSIWNMPDPSYDFDKIQQFTGLLDHKGKEIYEGDIVKSIRKGKPSMINRLILVKNGRNRKFVVVWTESIRYTGFNLGNRAILEVIGNIYENPKLV